MKRLVAMVVAAGAALAAEAMPTKAELQKAQAMVSDVTASDVSALRKKEKTPADVAARHMELAGQAGNEAEKYLLLQAAFKLYAKAGDYEGAANALGTMNREISDMAPEVIVEIYNNAIFSSMKEKAPKLFAIKESARRQVFYRKQLAKAEVAVKANPKDPAAQKKLGECHAELGDWPKALDVFVKAGGEFKKMSEGETSGKIPAQELGDFWWDYETKSDTQVYKLHAAELYRKALADDSFKGLARTRTEQRVKEVESVMPIASLNGPCGVANNPMIDMDKPLLLDLGQGQRLSFLPCPAGSFEMGGRMNGHPGSDRKHQVSITRPFYYLVGFVQTNHWATVMGRKMEKLDSPFVATRQEYEDFLRKLTERFAGRIPNGYVFRFLTEAEWLYAEKQSKMIQSEWSGFLLDLLGREQNGKWGRGYALAANSKGGHVKDLQYEDNETDPLVYCKDYISPQTLVFDFNYRQKKARGLEWQGFARIAIGPDLVAEKTAKGNGQAVISSKPSSTSRLAPMTFDLAKGVKLEMLGCPAGMFKMSNAPGGPNGDGTHEVKLTRTYWTASSCVTRAMYKAFEADYDKDEKTEGEKKPGDLVTGCARAEAFARWLNKRFLSRLPRGYVFRLPSEAEWEYAMNMGIVARHWDFEGTLDTVRAVSGKANAWKFDVSVMDYAATESDPVRVYSQNPAWVCRQDAKKRCLLRLDGQGCFRMVVGPDLIAEKKAKK